MRTIYELKNNVKLLEITVRYWMLNYSDIKSMDYRQPAYSATHDEDEDNDDERIWKTN